MRRVREGTSRVFRRLAGLEDGQAWGPFHIALYGFLGLTALALVAAWITGMPLSCLAGGVCG